MGALNRVVIVGGGHNGLAAAAYLARAGAEVTVLERLDHVGGAAISAAAAAPARSISARPVTAPLPMAAASTARICRVVTTSGIPPIKLA